MKAHFLPNEKVVLFLKDHFDKSSKPHIIITSVLAVHRGAIVVPEDESLNGTAQIICHGESATKGEYWYEYKNAESKGVSLNIVELSGYNEKYNYKTAQFIDD